MMLGKPRRGRGIMEELEEMTSEHGSRSVPGDEKGQGNSTRML